jgi:hypothetical protein
MGLPSWAFIHPFIKTKFQVICSLNFNKMSQYFKFFTSNYVLFGSNQCCDIYAANERPETSIVIIILFIIISISFIPFSIFRFYEKKKFGGKSITNSPFLRIDVHSSFIQLNISLARVVDAIPDNIARLFPSKSNVHCLEFYMTRMRNKVYVSQQDLHIHDDIHICL